MKTLSAFNTTATDSPFCAPVWLVEIDFGGSLTLYLCSAEFGEPGSICVFDSQIYEPLLLDVGTITGNKLEPALYKVSPGSFRLDIDNSQPVGGAASFSALFGTYDPHFATVDVALIFNGATASGDKIDLFSGKIDDFPAISQRSVAIGCSSSETELSSLFPAAFVNTTDYADADPDDIGKMLPYVYGQAKKVPFRAVDAGSVTELTGDLSDSATTINAGDTSGFDSSGTLQIENEKITYTGKTATTFTGCTRGYDSTTAANHGHGAMIGQVQAAYVYAMGHAVKSIDAVYVDKVLQPTSAYTAYTGQSASEYGGYSGQAVVVFNTLPIIRKQLNVTIEEDFDATDDIAVTEPGSKTELIPSGGQANCYDGNADTYYTVTNGTWQSVATFPSVDYGEISRAFVRLIADFGGASGELDIRVDGSTIGSITTANGGTKAEYRFEWSGAGASDWSEAITAQCDTVGETGKIYEIWWEYEYTADTTKTGDVSLTGGITGGNSVADTVIGGEVAVDVDGFQDDGSGTITGTPDALIEQPDHILEHLLTVVLGLASAAIDSTSYSAAGTHYDTNSVTLAVVMLEQPKIRELINDIAHQARSIEFWSAGAHYLIEASDLDTADKTISAAMIDRQSVKMSYTPRQDIRNDFTARYSREWAGYSDQATADRASVASDNTTSQTDYGTRVAQQREYPFILTSGGAESVLDWECKDNANPRRVIDLTGGFGSGRYRPRATLSNLISRRATILTTLLTRWSPTAKPGW
jgi:hypothetical protein